MQKDNKQLFKLNKKMILFVIALITVIATIIISFFIGSKNSNLINNANSELLRARTYDLFEDGDDIVEDTSGNPIDNIRFGAFFLRDIDGDGYADKIKGTCKQIGKEDTLYMELNVQTEGKLINGKIEIGGESFYLQTALPKDSELKNNYIGNNIKTIELNDIQNGTQKMLTGIVHSGDYTLTTGKFSAINNINSYDKVNTVVLTGTYVIENDDETTTEVDIRKEIDLEVDWYGTATATLSSTGQTNTNVGIKNTENNEVNLNFYLDARETKNELLLKDAYLTAEIPLLNGYEPTKVIATGTNINYSYDSNTRKLTITKEAETDEDGNVIKNAYDSYSYPSEQRYNKFNITVTYPLEAYESMGEDANIEIKVPVTAYYEGYNNPNSEFSNPYKTNIATATYTIRYQKPAEQSSSFRLEIGKYMHKPSARYVISKKKPLRIYNELSSEEKDDLYEVRWIARTGTQGQSTGITMKETPNGENRLNDEFVKADNSYESMENLTTNKAIYFSNALSMLGENGWIKVYDDETDNLLVTFEKNDWTRYTASNPYYYDVPIKHIRIETSSTNALTSMTVYNIKELDDEYITENYTREVFDTFKKIKTNLVGYLGENKITSTSNTAVYEAPFAIADITISKDIISTQSTEKNEIITIKAERNDNYNQVGWVNGSFLIKMPEDIFDMEINTVSINNSSVRVVSYEKFEKDGINYIKIITSNDTEASYEISIDCNLTPDPRIASKTEKIELYASSEEAEEYYYANQDIYDVNGNLNTEELVNKRDINISLISPNSLLTNQTAHNYDDEGTIVIAPKVAILDKERRFATVSVEIKNNYTSTISEVVVLGRVPYDGNKYVINGKEMGSNFSTTMTEDGIKIPEELQGIAVVYYSENGEATKDLSLEENGWTTEVTDYSKIKSYMIVLEDYALAIGESHVVSYEINIPEGLSYNQVSYSHHAVFFSLDTEEGKYRTQTEPNKIGFMIAKQYDLEVIKYQKDTEKVLGEVTFSIQEDGEEEAKTRVTGIDGKFKINGLYLDRGYTIKEIKGPNNYEISDDEIKFIGTEDDSVLNVDLITGNPKSILAIQPHDGEDYKIQVNVEDEVRPKLKIIKENSATGEKISRVKFKITGKGLPESGKVVTTNANGEANLSGLYIGEEYYLEETKAEGYYLARPIKFKIENNEGNYVLNIIEGEIKAQSIEFNDSIPTVNINLENDKIPTYNLEITKIKHVTNVEASSDPENPGAGDEEITYLEGAKFKLYKNGKELGSYISDENGKILIQGLYAYEDEKNIDQTYVLKEIVTPEGYAKVKDITFKVSKVLGVYNYEETLEEGQNYKDYTIEGNLVKLTVEDNPSFKLIKKDSETGEVLAGVKFAFYNMDDGVVPAKNSKGEIIGELETIDGQKYYTLTTDSNGEITADLPEGSYKAVEIDAPEKYDLSSNEYYFGIGMNQAGKAKINPLWSRKLEVSNGWSTAYDAINTRDGGYIVVGDFYTGLKLDDGTSLSGGPHLGNSTGFILKYDVYGHILWGNAWNEYNYGSHIRGVTELENGDIIAAGCYNESRNGLVIKYDSDGKNKEIIGTYNSSGLIEATNDGGFVLISGNNRLIKYNEDYETDFSKNINGIIITDIKILNNSIYISANYTNDNINLGNGFILHKNETSEQACAIIECDYDGNIINCKSFEASIKIDANKIELDSITNNIIMGCSFEGTITINNNEFNNYSNADILVLNCSDLFNVNWVKQINGQEDETISAITMMDDKIDIGINSNSTSLLDDDDILIEKENSTPVIIELLDDGKVNCVVEVSKISGSNIIKIYDLLQSEENNLIIVGRFSAYYERSIIAEASITWTDPKLEDVCELNILNERKDFKILTEINEIDGIKGGFISGEDIYPYERVRYGDDSIKEIKMIPNENYEIISITVNDEVWPFTPEVDGSYTMPTFENITEDKHIVVTYSLKNNKIIINKKDSVSGDELEGAKFKLEQIEERTEPDNSEIIGNLIDNGTIYTVPDYDKEVEGFIDLLTDLKYVEGLNYYFVPKINEDNSISYVPTNSKTWQEANVEGATTGVQSTTANSYIELDLSEMTGTYKVVINGYVSSQSGCDYGYATITTNEDSIVNPSSIPTYINNDSQYSRFIFISGISTNYTTSRDRESTIVLNGGQKYYLHLGYYKNASTDTGEDQFVINSIKLYETKDVQYNFEKKTIGEGEAEKEVYQSTNDGTYSKIANSYIPIDLTDYTGKYYLTVNADVSTTSGDYGYVTINKTASPAPPYNSSTKTNKRIIYKTGIANDEQTLEIDGGYLYYLHFGYYKDDILNTSGEDYFRVNSINLRLSDSELYNTIVETNSLGQAITQIPFGKYQITEISSPDDYVPASFPTVLDQVGNEISNNGVIEFRSTEGSLHEFTIENEKYGHVIVHHYIKGTETSLADDEYLIGEQGEHYSTLPKAGLNNYELEVVSGEQVLPINQIGTYTYDDIEVIYYYVQKKVPLTVNHFIEGTNVGVPLKDGNVAESIITYGEENESYNTEAISNDLLDDRYELVAIPENSTGIYSGNEIIVNYYYKELTRELIINKYDENGNVLKDVEFKVTDLESNILGEMTDNGAEYVETLIDTSENQLVDNNVISNGQTYMDVDWNNEVTGKFGELTVNGTEYELERTIIRETSDKLGTLTANGTYYFVENEEGYLVPTNSKTYQVNNGLGTAGIQNVTANSYMEIDLSELTGKYEVVINASVSSETNYDYGYATITQTISAPIYSNTNGRFMYISGVQANKDYSSAIMNGGNKYYLHLGYRKDASADKNDDQVVINSIKLYEVDTVTSISNFIQNEEGDLVPTNSKTYQVNNGLGTAGIQNVTANSYIPIDISDLEGNYFVVVEASVSSQGGNDYGYATINKKTTAPVYSNATGRFIYISGEIENKKYVSSVLTGGNTYYLHFGYYKNANTDTGDDQIVIHSIKLYSSQDISYNFVENEEGNLVPTNGKTYRENIYGLSAGVQSSVANSYMEIDLTGKPGLYTVVVNASVSSQSSNDFGYATITETTDAPAYNNTTGRFMYISGTIASTDYKSEVLEGGKKYYLHLGYYKNTSTDTGSDQLVINSINLYSSEQNKYNFNFEYNNEESCYISTNQGKDNSVSNSYIPIDLRGYDGQYTLVVNASVSSQNNYDYGYATVTQTATAPAYNNTNGRFIIISGEKESQDYTKILDGGNLYYLHLGYYKNANTNSGEDSFKINSITIKEEYGYKQYTTDANGQITMNLKVGTYEISELEAPEGFDLNTDVNTITVTRDSGTQILNVTNQRTKGQVIVHHYLKDSTLPVPMQDGTNAQDEIKENIVGEIYATKSLEGIDPQFKYINSVGPTSGTYEDGTIEVIYYYDYKDSIVTVHHYIEGTENSLSNDVVITGQITSHYETEVATDIPEYYELVEEPLNKEGTITYAPIEVIYEYRLKKYPYIVNYYKNGTTEKLAESKNGEEVTHGESIKAEDEEIFIIGYKVVGYNKDELVIGTENNILNIYYDIDESQTKDLNYTVEYYKDDVKVDSDTQTESATVQVLSPDTMEVDKTKINTANKYIGYKLDTENTVIPDEVENGDVIKVYYVKDKFNYTVEYYYDGIIDEDKTDLLEGLYGDIITTYTDKNIEGYKLYKTINLPLTITENASQNIIKVYYERKDYKYTVNYYYDNNLEESIELESKFGNIINDFTDIPKENYEFEKVENIPLTISINEDENIINVYYRKKDSKLIVEYRDYETDEVILENKVIDVKYGDEIVLDDYSEDIDDYTLVESSEPNRFIISDDEYTKTFYYAKNSNVVVKYLVKDDTPETNSDNTVLTYIDEEGNEKEYTYEILGYEGKEYSAEEKEIEGYTFVEATDNTSGKMKRETVEVIYYYLKNSKIIVNHIDRENNEVIETEEIDGKVGDIKTTNPKDFEGYELIKRPDEETITMTEEKKIVNYYYAKISGGVVEKHIDIKTDEVLDMTKYKGNEGDRYTTSEKEFDGYDLVEERYPENKDGIMTIEPIEVKYYYIRKTSVKAQYIDYITGEVIPSKESTEDGEYVEKDSTEYITGYEGDEYKTEEKEFEGYDIVKEKYPENKDGIMEVLADPDGNAVTETLVKFYYVHKSAGVIENHIDIKTNELLDTKTYEGHVGDTYKTKEKEFEGYDLVEEKYPENAEGNMEINKIVVNYYYIRKVIVVVEYIDETTKEPILEKEGSSTDEFSYYKDSTEFIEGHVGDEYETKSKDFDKYKLIETPNNKDGKMEIISTQETNNIQEIHVIYKYVKEAEEVIEKHIDIFTGEELADEKTYTGYEGDNYNTNKKEIDNYDLIEVPENAEGVMTDEKIEVKYYYARKTHLIVKYIDLDTGEEIERREIINGHQNDNYTTEAKEISNFKLLQEKYPENSSGKMLIDETYVTYYYQRVQENKKEGYVPEVLFVTSGGNTEKVQNTESTKSTKSTNTTSLNTNVISKNNNKVDIAPNTGDNTPVKTISLIILVIVINVMQIIWTKGRSLKSKN